MLEQAAPVATGGTEGQGCEDLDELAELDAKVHDAEALGDALLCSWSRGQFTVVPGTSSMAACRQLRGRHVYDGCALHDNPVLHGCLLRAP